MSQLLQAFQSTTRAYHGDQMMQMSDCIVHHRVVVYDGEHMESPQILRADPNCMVKTLYFIICIICFFQHRVTNGMIVPCVWR